MAHRSSSNGGDNGGLGCLLLLLIWLAYSILSAVLTWVEGNWRLLIVAAVSVPGFIAFALDMRDRASAPNRPTRASAFVAMLVGALISWGLLGLFWDEVIRGWLTKTWTETQGSLWWKKTVTRRSLDSDSVELYRWVILLLQPGVFYALWRFAYFLWRRGRSAPDDGEQEPESDPVRFISHDPEEDDTFDSGSSSGGFILDLNGSHDTLIGRYCGTCANTTHNLNASLVLYINEVSDERVKGKLSLKGDLAGGGRFKGTFKDGRLKFVTRTMGGRMKITWKADVSGASIEGSYVVQNNTNDGWDSIQRGVWSCTKQ